jgi:isoamylase
VKWSGLHRDGEDLTSLIARLSELRRSFPQLRARHWLAGRHQDGSYDVLWFTSDASEMTEEDWNFSDGRFLAYALGPLRRGEPPLLVMLNAAAHPIDVTLPTVSDASHWTARLNTAAAEQEGLGFAANSTLQAPGRSVLVFSGEA